MTTHSWSRRTTGAAVLATVLATLLAGCSSGATPSSSSSPSPTPTSTSSTAPPAPAAPTVGSCHRLTLQQATGVSDASAPVPCGRPHTTVTVKVGRLADLTDGHLLAVDSATVQSRLQQTCPPTGLRVLGGSTTTQRLSRFQQVWFTPTVQQADQGAGWYRCDVVAVASTTTLLPLPRTVKGVLAAGNALDRWGTCGTNAPGSSGFARVVCTQRHSWRAVSVVDLPQRTRYLAKPAAAQGDASCKSVAAARANGALKYTWTFEWPTRAAWTAGQRFGYCWVPDSA